MGTKRKRTAVIEDMDAFMAFLASTPFVREARDRLGRMDAFGNVVKPPAQKSAAAAVDTELLDALSSMA